jgi:hypothetical protein
MRIWIRMREDNDAIAIASEVVSYIIHYYIDE